MIIRTVKVYIRLGNEHSNSSVQLNNVKNLPLSAVADCIDITVFLDQNYCLLDLASYV